MSEKKLSKSISHSTSALNMRMRKLNRGYFPQSVIIVLFVILVVLMFPRGKSFEFSDLKVGEIYIGEPIVAPFTFSINKSPEEYQRDKDAARNSVLPYFFRSDSAASNSITRVRNTLSSIKAIVASDLADSTKHYRLRDIFTVNNIHTSSANIDFLINQFSVDKRSLTKQEIKTNQDEKRSELSYETFSENILRTVRDITSIGILNIAPSALPNSPQQIALKRGAEAEMEDISYFKNTATLNDDILNKLRTVFENDAATHIGFDMLSALIKPNIFYDLEETEKKIRQVISRVPRAKGTVLEKEKIIYSNERITDDHIQKLNSLAEEKAKREGQTSGFSFVRPFVGKVILVTIGIVFLLVYLYQVERKIFLDPKKLLMILISLLLVLYLSHIIGKFSLSEYLIPAALASMLLTIFYNPSLAFVGTVSLALLLGGLRGNAFSAAFLAMAIGGVSILSVKRVRSRSWLFKSILWLTSGYIVTICTLELLRYSSFDEVSINIMYGVMNGFLIPVLTYGLSVIFEYIFEMTTDATLLELSDLNKPVLRKLALRAPGSYHHSILIGQLSEAAAEAIGANSLLTRVGSYYHDIGKMDKPEYFIENQKGGRNPHEKLSPSMSFLILVSHVKRGLEIAQEYGLPKEIQAFISEHHGTNLVTYFYKKALEKGDGTEVNEIDFRYPGPKPQTKETGIVMLADAVEAASRTLKEPSVSRLRNLVNGIIDDRFKNHELDESPLTLRELTQIKEAFVQILTGIFHGRIEYPDQDKLSGGDYPIKPEKHLPELKTEELNSTEKVENGTDQQSEPIQKN